MIIGAHAIVHSKDPDADRAFLKDVLGFRYVDAGDGWLIFGLPPAEVAVHPSDENDVHELYLMTDDVMALVAAMKAHGVEATRPSQQGWGVLTRVKLPGGGKLGIYQPRHPSPPPHRARAGPRKRTRARTSAPSRKRPKKPGRGGTRTDGR